MANMQMNKTPMPEQEPNIRNANFKEVALGYTFEQAVNEAKRCLQCKNPACVDGPDFDGHKVDFDEVIARNATYKEFETKAKEKHLCRLGGGAMNG